MTDPTAPTGSALPSGEQWTLRHGADRTDELTVVEVGGGLRSWTRDGVDVLAGYPADAMALAGRGQLLVPWPNRVADGRWTWDGVDLKLPLTEPDLHNASHGLVRWASWHLVGQEADEHGARLTVGHRLHPQPGWSWVLDLEVTYALGDDGLSVTTTATNRSGSTAPYGYGAHPYLSLGDTPLTDVVLTVPARRWLEVTPDRLLPVATHPVDGTPYDFRAGRAVGGTALDNAYTDLERDPDGRWTVVVEGVPHGRLTLWGDEHHPWLQVFTGRATSATEGTNGIAVEPMTCPPGALMSGTDLLLLEPGASRTTTWGVRVG